MLAIDLILDIIEPYDMVLAMGHISISESKPLVAEARNIGIQHVVVTHATTMSYWTSMTVEDVKEVAEMVAFIEQWLYVVMPTTHRRNPKDLAKTTLDIGPKKCSGPVEAMRMESPPYCAQD